MESSCLMIGSKKVRTVREGGRELLRFYAPQVLGECRAAEHFRALCDILEQYALREVAEGAKREFADARAHSEIFLPHRVCVEIFFCVKKGVFS